MEGQTSGDSADPEVGISSIREALSDQDAGFHGTYDVCVCVMRGVSIIRDHCCHYVLPCLLMQLV